MSQLLAKVEAGETVEVAYDQISTPTSMDALAKGIIALMSGNEYGIYHVSCEGSCTRYEFAKKILELTGHDTSLLKPVLAKDIEGGHQRPLHSVLENLMLKMTGIYKMPEWSADLAEYFETRGMKYDR